MSIEDVSLKINELVIEKTLSLEAIKVVEQIRSEYRLLQEQLEQTQASYKHVESSYREKINSFNSLQDENNKLIMELNQFKQREQELISRETKIELKDLEVKLTNQSKQETLDLVKCIFRNPVTTRFISKNEHVASTYKDSYGNYNTSQYPVTNSESITERTE